MNISDILARRADNAVVTISPDATVRELVETLANHNIGACVVSSDGAAIDGIVSERDVVRRLSDTEDLANLPVSQIMTSSVLTCAPATGLDELMGLMTERRFRHVPVVEDGTMVGIVSLGDAVKHRIDELTFERDQLATYVNS
ncbi:MAG: CBS domain-containing protein [Nocardioides sp.]